MSAKPPKRTLMMMVVAFATVAVAMPAAADARKPVVHELTVSGPQNNNQAPEAT